ncbi:glycosyltransferase family 4 protein [bacterium]|nr:glycosyltransferase family 4 protein [candidate division CSSED10-310 bacterium]
MKILQVIHNFPLQGGAGAENYTMQICKALSREHELSVLTFGGRLFDGPYGQIGRRSGFAFPVFAFFSHPANFDDPEKEYWNPDFENAFRRLLDSVQPDVIHFQHVINLSISLVTTAVACGYPVYFTLHDFWTICPNIVLENWRGAPCDSWKNGHNCTRCMAIKYRAPRIWLKSKNFYNKRRQRMVDVLESCRAVLSPSKALMSICRDAGFDNVNLVHWPFGMDSKAISKKQSSQPLSLPIRFGYTGTISPQKGIEVMLKSFHALPALVRDKVRLYVYGGCGTDTRMLRSVSRWKCMYASESIQFMGRFDQECLPEILDELDVVICPSTWYENRPLSILESFAAGNPVIASRLGGMIELVEETGAGWVFKPANPESLSSIIEKLVSDPDQIRKIRDKIPEVLSINDEVKALQHLYVQTR